MTEVCVTVVIAIVLGVILGIAAVHCDKKKKKTTRTVFYFDQELFDTHIPYNGPDFINRFETDPWELRTGRHND